MTVKAGQDADAANDTATLTHTASGGDYALVSNILPVTVSDDDSRGVVLSETGLTVTEGEAAGSSYTVKLATQPTGEVTVTVSGHAGTDLSLDKTTLTFTADNWNTAQTVTVKADDDADADADTATLTHTASGGDYASVSNILPVTVSDDDSRGVVLSKTGLTVTEGEAAGSSYTVKLATRPTGEVTVTVSGHAGTDLTLDKTTLTFTADNWNTAQTVTVKADDDADAANDTATLTHTASGGDYALVSNILPVRVTDDDEAGVRIEPTALSVVAGRSNEYTVVLATEPTGEVTVTVSGHAGTDLSVYGATLSSDMLTFTVDNWDTAQTVTVSDTQNAATGKVTLAHAVAGADYGSVTAEPVVVSVVAVADQQPTLQVGVSSSTQTLTIPEGGANSYALVLGSRPTGDVSVGVTLPAGTDLSLDKTTLTFTADNWDTAQTVAVTAAEDDDAVTDAGVRLTHTVSGGGYGSTTVPDVEVSITENDTPAVVLSKTGLTVTEGEAAGSSYTVKLATEPTGEVTVTVSGHAGTDLSLDKTTLTFTADNWNTAQTVTVKADDDADAANDTATLTHTASGGDYASVSNILPVTVSDDDSRGVVLSETGLTVTEGEAAGSSYTVKLATQPTGEVTVTVSGHAGTDLSLDKTTLTFTADNWNTAQTVTVKADDDADADADTATLTHTASGGDYASVSNILPVTVSDDDSRGVVLSKTGLTVTEGEAAGSSYTVKLATQPTGEVTVTVSGHAGTDLTLDKTTLTFTVGNWNTAQTVTVKAGQDADAANDTATLTHTASGGDYALVSNILPVRVTDDDEAGVRIEPTALSVVAGRSNEYTVVLATEPTGEVTVTVSGHAGTDLSVYGATLSSDMLTFTVDNWDTAQTVTVSDTQNAATGKVTLAHAVAGADYGSVTAEPVVVSVVAVADQQPTLQVGVSSSTQTLTIPEGGANSYALVLGSRPTGDVSVGVTLPAGTDLSLDKTTLTFTADNWDTAQTVAVTAAEDDDAVTDAGVRLTHTVSGGGYGSTTVPDVEVSITENDTPAVVLSKTGLTVTEGEAVGSSYTVKLATEPTGEVTVTVSGHAGTDLTLSGTTLTNNQLTFTTTNWGTAQTVTVEAGEDDDAANESETLAHSASGGDYVNITKDLPVSITDDDAPPVAVSFDQASYRVLEGDTVTVGVTLSGDPERTVVIPLVTTEEGGASSEDYSGVPSSVTINEGETSKTFEFMAMADDASDAGEGVMIGFGTNLPSRVAEGTPNEARVSINQMSTQLGSGVAVSFEMGVYTVSEGGTQAVTVMLSTAPSQTTVIPITTTNQGGATSADYSGVPASVTFNAGETLMSFNFMATQDDVDENCECVLLTFGALPSGVSAGPTDEAKVSIADIATTPEGTPTVPPGPFDLTAYGKDQSLNVMWEIPAGEDARAPVTSYLVRYRQVGASSWRNVSRANDGLTLWEDITGLTNRRAYEVQVAAVSRMGPGAWASVKGTPQAPYAPPPGPEGDEAFDVGRLRIYWLDPDADQTNVLHRESCTGSEGFRVFWTGPDGNRRADEWAVHINTRRGAGEVSYSFDESSGPPDRTYFSMNGTVNFEGDSALSLSVRGSFGSTWGRWSTPVSLYCHEPEAPTDTCDLQVQQQAVGNTPAEGGPRIDGIPEVGQTLSADTTAIADADGLEEVVFQYQWLAEDAEIAGATGSTYSLTSGDVGKAIKVQVTFTDDDGNEETLTSAPAAVTTAAGLQLQSAIVDGTTLTLTYSEVLDTDVTLPKSAFALNVNGSSRSLIGTGVGQSDVLLLLSSAVESGDTVTVDYTVPEGQDLIQDTHGRKAPSFSGQAVTNDTAPATDDTAKTPEDTASTAPLTATIHDQPSSHNGEDAFTFELRFSEDPQPDFSYTTVRDHAFTVTGGSVTYVRRLEPGKNVRWEVTVTPGSSAAVAIALNATTDCAAQGAICTEEGGKLSGGLQLAVPGPNTPATETPNAPATGLPSISGTAQVGDTLTAVTSGIEDADGLDNVTFNHQWLADDADIAGATGGSYILADADEGKTIKVKVSFTDDVGNEESLTSAATAAVAAGGDPTDPPGSPRNLTGATNSDGTVTLSWDAPNDDSVTGYQILRRRPSEGESTLLVHVNDTESTATHYTDSAVTPAVLHAYRVKAINAVGLSGQSNFVNVTPGQPTEPAQNSPATGTPTISGTAQVGETLTASTSHIADSDGLNNAAFSYRWIRNDGSTDTDIQDATGASHTLVDADEGRTIKVEVNFADDAGNAETLTSAATTSVAARPNSPATGAPTISGTAQVGERLTADTSGIEDDDGLDDAAFAHQWLADDTEINGATAATYTLVAADEDKAIRVRASFTDDAGNGEELTSAATGAVAPKPNTPAVGTPAISGTAQVSETFTADIAGISDGDGLDNATFTYRWLGDDAEINGATAATYTLVAADAGKAIKVQVSFTDDAGNDESLTSGPTAAVAEAEPSGPPPAPQNLTAVVNGDGHIVLSWEAPDDDSITGYQILRRRPTMGEDTLLVYVADTQNTATTYTDTNVTAGVQHAYRVRAINAAGVGPVSNFVDPTP